MWKDIVAGVAAIVVVVGVSMAWHEGGFVGIFALTAAAFFAAGSARGGGFSGNLAWKAARLSVGGLLGIAALIMNNGLHLWAVHAGLMLTALAYSAAGVVTRRDWTVDRLRSVQIVALASLAAAVGIPFVVPALSRSSAFESVNRAAPAFRLAVNGASIGPAELRGRVVVLAFWASWCLPCQRELPELDRVRRQFARDARVAVLAVDTGWGDETAEVGAKYLARRHLDIPMAFDNGEAAKAFGVDGLPTMAAIDARGRVRFLHRGYDASEHMAAALADRIDRLLTEAAR